jgi:septum formation protein
VSSIILASTSAVRRQILDKAGIAFEAMPANVDEGTVKEALLAQGIAPRGIADALAELKAMRVSQSHPEAFVIGCDQVLVLEGEFFSKSPDIATLRTLLLRLRGQTHELFSAVVLAKAGSPVWRRVDRARMTMRAFSDEFLDDYLEAEGESLLSSVGGYYYEGRGAQLFSEVVGDFFSILGLPLLPLLAALREQGAISS